MLPIFIYYSSSDKLFLICLRGVLRPNQFNKYSCLKCFPVVEDHRGHLIYLVRHSESFNSMVGIWVWPLAVFIFILKECINDLCCRPSLRVTGIKRLSRIGGGCVQTELCEYVTKTPGSGKSLIHPQTNYQSFFCLFLSEAEVGLTAEQLSTAQSSQTELSENWKALNVKNKVDWRTLNRF